MVSEAHKFKCSKGSFTPVKLLLALYNISLEVQDEKLIFDEKKFETIKSL